MLLISKFKILNMRSRRKRKRRRRRKRRRMRKNRTMFKMLKNTIIKIAVNIMKMKIIVKRIGKI